MNSYRIALLGDAMFESWGEECPELRQELTRLYAYSQFEIENHGLAGTRSGYGLWRIANDYPKNGAIRRALSYSNPDIVIVESFAYTDSADGPEGLTEYRDILRRIWEEIRQTTHAKTLFCVTQPPERNRFLENVPNYVNSSRALRQRMADDVKLYLDEARAIAEDEGWLLADVCAEVERQVAGGEPHRRYIDQNNNCHPSRYGFAAQARVLVRTIDEGRLIEEVIHK